jgi:hypothetical protein
MHPPTKKGKFNHATATQCAGYKSRVGRFTLSQDAAIKVVLSLLLTKTESLHDIQIISREVGGSALSRGLEQVSLYTAATLGEPRDACN